MASTTPVAATVTNFVNELKHYYHPEKVANMMYDHNPLLKMIKKRTDWTGYTWELPIKQGGHQGGGGSFAQAKKFKRAGVHQRFSIPFVRAYQLADVDNALIDFSANSKGSFIVDALQNAVEDSITQHGNSTAAHLVNASGQAGARGLISGAPTGTGPDTATLADPDQVINFEIGMVLSYGTTAANAAAIADADLVEVTAVDRHAGTVTYSIGAGDQPADGDYLFLSGDEDSVITGIGDYLVDHSAGAPSALHGMTRTSDPTRLAGIFYDADTPNDNTEDAIRFAMSKARRLGQQKAHVCVVSPDRFTDLGMLVDSSAAAGRTEYPGNSPLAKLGVKTIAVFGALGEVPVMVDPYVTDNVGYLLDLDTWCLLSAGPWGKFLRNDGRGRTNEDSDSLEIRFGGYGNLGCSAPGKNTRIKFNPLA